MIDTLASAKGRWAVAGIGAAVVVAVFFVLFRQPMVPLPLGPAGAVAASSPPPVALARAEAQRSILAEETKMRDLTPLFLPTERNATLPRPKLREPGASFLETPPLKLSYKDSVAGFHDDLPPIATLNGKRVNGADAVDALPNDPAAQGFPGFGRQPVAVVALTPRGGFVEVVAMATGHVVLAVPLPVEARPATDQLWQPIELLAKIDAAGLVMPPVITSGSRVEQVDQHYRNYLVRNFGIGERLPPGLYRITVGQ